MGAGEFDTQPMAETLFDDSFYGISFHEINGLMTAVDLIITHDGKKYLLAATTLGQHMDRVAEDSEEVGGEEPKYVLSKDEILPSDLQAIKETPFANLELFLVEQPED